MRTARSAAGGGRPSAEALLHVEIVRCRGGGAVLHTHSVWSTILSERHASAGGLGHRPGYEMLKGLEGVPTHEHREWIPILENDQDMTRARRAVSRRCSRNTRPATRFLLAVTALHLGRDLAAGRAPRRDLEFLFEIVGRTEAEEHHHGHRQNSR